VGIDVKTSVEASIEIALFMVPLISCLGVSPLEKFLFEPIFAYSMGQRATGTGRRGDFDF
jgi:hypothetical protein